MYAKAADLAQALHKARFDEREAVLAERCLRAATAEIDGQVDWFYGEPAFDELTEDQRAVVHMVCVDRAAEWWKSADAAFRLLGYADIGTLRVPPDPFDRHRAALIDAGIKQKWAIA